MANRLDLNDRGSFLEDENQMVIDAEIVDIGLKLFEEGTHPLEQEQEESEHNQDVNLIS